MTREGKMQFNIIILDCYDWEQFRAPHICSFYDKNHN